MKYKLSKSASRRLREKLKEHGYSTQKEVAEAIKELGHYKKATSLPQYLSQVINGARPASQKIVQGLLQICNNDEEISEMFQNHPKSSLEDELEIRIDKLYDSLRERFIEASEREKMVMYMDFEDYIKRYSKTIEAE